MDKEAHKQAWERFNKARGAHQKLLAARSFSDVDEAWSDFLIAASGVYSKLEKGTKGHAKAEPWFGQMKRERKDDELLRYIHHARNADEHGIKRITQHQPGGLGIGAEGSMLIRSMRIQGGKVVHLDAEPTSPGSKLIVKEVPWSVVLVPVTDDRFNDTFQPPTTHLGNPIPEQTPAAVATLALAYLDSLIRSAGAFLK